MNQARRELLDEYARLLHLYLSGGGEGALQRSYELAREAMAGSVGVLDMATIHHETLATIIGAAASEEERTRVMKAAEVFFLESLSPFEMTHRSFRESNAALRCLNERLEDEAKRIAHALHDEAGQLLACVHIVVSETARGLPPAARKRLLEVRGLLDRMSEQLRRLSHELRPTILDDLGLMPALRFLAEGVSSRSRTPISVEGTLEERLAPVVETAVYRIVQEALTNVIKHARGTRASVKVDKEAGGIRCVVRDDGRGFDAANALAGNAGRGLGLVGIRERLNALGGRLEITSAPGQGTDLLITIPTEG